MQEGIILDAGTNESVLNESCSAKSLPNLNDIL